MTFSIQSVRRFTQFFVSLAALAAASYGCGGGGGDDDDDSGVAGATVLAPDNLIDRQVQISFGGQPSTFVFSSDTFVQFFDGTAIASGSYVYTRQTFDRAVLVLNQLVPATDTTTLQLNFSSETAGTTTFQTTTGQSGTGAFFNLGLIPSDGGFPDDGDPTDPQDDPQLTPETLLGRTADILLQSGRFPGAIYRVTFVSPTEFTTSIDGASGVYTYTGASSNEATLVLDYTNGPLDRERDVFNLFFKSRITATFSGFSTRENQEPIFAAGTLQFVN